MMMKSRFWIALATVLLVSMARGAAAQGTLMTWTIDGVQREALVFTPSSEQKGVKHPLVFGFHGHGGNMKGASVGMHLQDLWPEAIVVYPQGLPTESRIDPEGLRPGWQAEAAQNGDRDLKFFDTMLSAMKEKYSVDDKQVYTSGFSNGAIFSYLLWSERGKALAGLGVASGRLLPSVHPSEARPIILIAGEQDRLIPIADQKQSIETVRQIDHATANGQSCGQLCSLYSSTTHTPVMALIHPRGHVYPPWAGKAMVDFFKSQK